MFMEEELVSDTVQCLEYILKYQLMTIILLIHCTSSCTPAYCDVHDHLDCYKWILKERNRYGEKWHKQWAQEHAIKRVLFELPAILARNAIPTDKQAFSTWASFQKEFLASGKYV